MSKQLHKEHEISNFNPNYYAKLFAADRYNQITIAICIIREQSKCKKCNKIAHAISTLYYNIMHLASASAKGTK